MLANEELYREKDPRLVTNTAMNAFFRITNAWCLKPQEQKVLLGDQPNSTYYKWRNGEGPMLSRDTLERVSYVMGITRRYGCSSLPRSKPMHGRESPIAILPIRAR